MSFETARDIIKKVVANFVELYAILIISEHDLPHEELLLHAVVWTCTLSIMLHGSSAAPGAAIYGKMASDPAHCPGEHEEVFEHLTRDNVQK